MACLRVRTRLPAAVALFPHQDHANAVAQEGGKHGQATDVKTKIAPIMMAILSTANHEQ